MENKVIQGDITTMQRGIIAQQVNAAGVMGAGLALAIRKRYEVVYQEYRDAYEAGRLHLGQAQFSAINDQLKVANLVGQRFVGTQARQTNYMALGRALKEASDYAASVGLALYVPFKIGCGLAGGHWSIVSSILEVAAPNAIVTVLPEEWKLYLNSSLPVFYENGDFFLRTSDATEDGSEEGEDGEERHYQEFHCERANIDTDETEERDALVYYDQLWFDRLDQFEYRLALTIAKEAARLGLEETLNERY